MSALGRATPMSGADPLRARMLAAYRAAAKKGWSSRKRMAAHRLKETEVPPMANTALCPHGMPSPASCVECMYDDGLPPDPKPPVPRAVAYALARHEGQCAMDLSHRIEEGDPIGLVEDVGWCCEQCFTVFP